MQTATDTTSYHRRVILLTGAVLLFRLLYAAFFAKNPAGDEAYYWDWGRQLDYGYYSKPPFIAWLYAFVDWIGQGSLFAIRATAAVLGTASLYLLYQLATSLFDSRTGWIAVILGLVAPANSVLSFFLTIDAPLVFCWTVALWMFWRYVSGTGRGGSLCLLFIALAIGHLCKQMMMVFPVLAILFLATHAGTRPLLRRPALWATLLGSYLALLPPLIWNARHDWITFKHTSHHFEVKSDGGNAFLEHAGDFFSFLGSQFGVLSPGTAYILFSLSLAGLFAVRRSAKPVRYLLVFGAIPITVMLVMALRQEMQPNWAAVYYVSGLVLTAGWYAGRIESSYPPPRLRRLFPVTVGMGTFLVCYFYFSPLIFTALGRPGHKADPNRRLMGHDLVAEQFETIRRTLPDAKDHFLVALGHRDVTSELAFGLPDQPRVYRWESGIGISSQYEMWNNPVEDGLAGKNGLILVPESSTLPAPFTEAFQEVQKRGEFEVAFGFDNRKLFSVYEGRNLLVWPKGTPPGK